MHFTSLILITRLLTSVARHTRLDNDQGRDFHFIFNGPEFANQVMLEGANNWGANGTIGFVANVAGPTSVPAVKI